MWPVESKKGELQLNENSLANFLAEAYEYYSGLPMLLIISKPNMLFRFAEIHDIASFSLCGCHEPHSLPKFQPFSK